MTEKGFGWATNTQNIVNFIWLIRRDKIEMKKKRQWQSRTKKEGTEIKKRVNERIRGFGRDEGQVQKPYPTKA